MRRVGDPARLVAPGAQPPARSRVDPPLPAFPSRCSCARLAVDSIATDAADHSDLPFTDTNCHRLTTVQLRRRRGRLRSTTRPHAGRWIDFIEMLKEQGADLSSRDLARSGNPNSCIRTTTRQEHLPTLVRPGLCNSPTSQFGQTALHWVAEGEGVTSRSRDNSPGAGAATALRLLELGAKIDAEDHQVGTRAPKRYPCTRCSTTRATPTLLTSH